MNKGLSRLVAGLFAQAKEGQDLSSGINRVRTVIKKVIAGEDTILGKFHTLVESFREVIPEEKQRYQAAIKALSTTSKLSRQEIVTAVNNQLQELKILEKLLISALPRGPEELKAMEAKAQKIRNEISRLREKTAQLEKEEKEVAGSMTGREKGPAAFEKAMREVFTDIGAELTTIKKMVEEQREESAAQQPIRDMEIKTDSAGGKQSGGQESITGQISSHNAAKPQKTCPMCGAEMSLSTTGRTWQCFSCAYEESEKDEVQGKNGEPSEDAISPEPTPVPELKQAGEKGEQGTTPEPTPASELKQKCPMCGGQMDYYMAEGKWQCYSCGFEYFKKEDGQRKSEEKREHSNVLMAISPAESLFDLSSAAKSSPGYWEPKKASSQPPIKKKTCPACGKKMYWYGSEKSWRCNDCGYERRI